MEREERNKKRIPTKEEMQQEINAKLAKAEADERLEMELNCK